MSSIRHLYWAFGLILLFATKVLPATVEEAFKDFYESKQPPNPQLLTEGTSDTGVFKQLQIPSILAVLKYELSTGSWPKLSSSDKTKLISILDDTNLKLIYTGKQSTMATSAGGQTIDKDTVKFNQDGWYSSGAGAEARSPSDIAKIILHEVGHVYQERYNILPRGPFKESFPEELESQLSSARFTPDNIKGVTEFLSGTGSSETCPDVSGSWQGTLKVDAVDGESPIDVGQKRLVGGDQFKVTQKDCDVTLSFNNSQISGKMVNGTATLNVDVTGTVIEATLKLTRTGLDVLLKQGWGKGTTIRSSGMLTR